MQSVTNLSAFGFETAEIVLRKAKPAVGDKPAVPEAKIVVRGLGSHDVMRIVRVHGPSLVQTLTAVLASRGDTPEATDADALQSLAGEFIVRLSDQVPDAIADMIVVASDDPEPVKGFAIAKKLPLPVQLKAVQEIVRLTLEDFGGLGELMETVVTLLGGANGLATLLRSSQAGAMTSSEQSPS